MSECPIFVPDNLRLILEKEIVRGIKQPELWDDNILPSNNLLLICGQKGTQMLKAVMHVLKEHNIFFYEKYFSPTEKMPEYHKMLIADVVILNNAHLLQNYPKLWDVSGCSSHFVICISHEIYHEEHPFYKQFENNKIVMDLPTPQFCKQLLQYYFNGWSKHWKYSQMLLNDEDFEWLANFACAYCTGKDIKRFYEKVCRKVLQLHPEVRLDITLDLLQNINNLFLFQPFNGNKDIYCLVNDDKQKYQSMFDTKIQQIPLEPIVKRSRIDTTLGGEKSSCVGFVEGLDQDILH